MQSEEIFLEKDRTKLRNLQDSMDNPNVKISSHNQFKERPMMLELHDHLPQCDSCLEFSIHSDSQLLECISCRTTIHEQCQVGIKSPQTNWQCERCTFAIKNKQSYTFYKYNGR
jgi:hypothetical protein